MEIVFRKAQREDVKGIIELCNNCFDESTSVKYALEVFDKTANDPNQIYLVGLDKDEIIAHMKITIIQTMYKPMATYAILNHVCVKPEYRRHNIATKMLDEGTIICSDMGCNKIELWSNNSRQPAHACYKNYGFVVNDAGFFSKDI